MVETKINRYAKILLRNINFPFLSFQEEYITTKPILQANESLTLKLIYHTFYKNQELYNQTFKIFLKHTIITQ